MKIRTIAVAIITICVMGTAGMLFYPKNLQQSPSPEACVEKRLDEIFKENEAEDSPDGVDLAALFMYKIQGTQLACALSDPTEHQEAFFENSKIGFQKINYEVTELTQSSETAEVLIRINYFKLLEIVPKAQEEFQKELEKDTSLSSEEMADKIYEAIANEFQKGPSDDSRVEITVALYKNGNEWEIEDSFEDTIFEAILQQGDTSEQSSVESTTAEQSETVRKVNVVDVTRKAADDFTVYDENKNKVRLQDSIGKPLIVNFWASWCPPCKREMSAFQNAINLYGEEVNFMMVNEADAMETAQAFWDENGYKMNIFFDLDGNAATTYKILALPRTLVIDENGRIVEDHVGELTEEELNDTIKKLIDQAAVSESDTVQEQNEEQEK